MSDKAKATYRDHSMRRCGNCGRPGWGIRSDSSFAIRNKAKSRWCPLLAGFVNVLHKVCDDWEAAA